MVIISDRTLPGHKYRKRCPRRRDCRGVSIARSKTAPAAGLQMTRPGYQVAFLLRFPAIPYRPPMPDTPNLRPATPDELTQSLSFALRFNGRKRVHDADETITAERLVEHPERSGYVVMHKPPCLEFSAKMFAL